MDLSVDLLTRESVQYSTGDVLVIYAVIVVIALAVVLIAYKLAAKKNPKHHPHG